MQLLVIRHAKAVDHIAGESDAARALTPEGRRKMQRAAAGLAGIVPRIDLIATSPLVRARQTAGIVAAAYPEVVRIESDLLAPGGDPQAIGDWLLARDDEIIAVVGHEPDLGELVSWMLSGERRSFVAMKKGAVCSLALSRSPAAGAARLMWLLTAGQLEKLT
jgi:phosphohistidine phosphatase